MVALSLSVTAQPKPAGHPLEHPFATEFDRTQIFLPQIDGKTFYKADLHLHTIFSDGDVTPDMRVVEAWYDGLDIIAITDHMEYRRIEPNMLKFMNKYVHDEFRQKGAVNTNIMRHGPDENGIMVDFNVAYDLASKKAYYDKTGDENIPKILEKHYLTYTLEDLDLPVEPQLKKLGVGCHAYEDAVAKYSKGRGGIEPTSVENTSVEDQETDAKDNTQAVYVQRGPLLYSFAIPQTKTEDKKVYANMHGKVPGNPDFKCWSIEPAGEWNYAVDLTKDVDLEYSEGAIRIPVRKIDWTLQENRYTPKVPAPEDVKPLSDEVVYLDLVPYGGTELRLTVFPIVK